MFAVTALVGSLKEVWLLHTKIKADAAKALEERLEGVRVYHG